MTGYSQTQKTVFWSIQLLCSLPN